MYFTQSWCWCSAFQVLLLPLGVNCNHPPVYTYLVISTTFIRKSPNETRPQNRGEVMSSARTPEPTPLFDASLFPRCREKNTCPRERRTPNHINSTWLTKVEMLMVCPVRPQT